MSTVASAQSTAPVTLPRWEEDTDGEDSINPDKLFQCPYDQNHHIRVCRFPYHLLKCRKNHPALASELKTCPFNARHLMPKHELTHHMATCVDRSSVNTVDLGSAEIQGKWQVPVTIWSNPNPDGEDWDTEADPYVSAPFKWGLSTTPVQIRPEPSPGPVHLRTPRTLPWKTLDI